VVSPKALIVLDFDHTLFDARRFLQAIQIAAIGVGVSKRQFERTFTLVTDAKADATYNIQDHADALCLEGPRKNTFVRSADRAIRASAEFLYPDTVPFLKKLRRWNIDSALVTYSEAGLRQRQLKAAGIIDYFNEVQIVSSTRADKVERIRALCGSVSWSAVFDDHPAVLVGIQKFADLPIRIRRRVVRRYVGKEPPLPGVPVFRDLPSAYQFILPILRTF
jgi:phosphoglycolate phosphatase-like HAD superfamily hydrolase